MNAQVLGISVDHVPVLKAWADTFQGIQYPLLSDFWPHGKVCQQYGVLRDVGSSERAIFIIDKDGLIQYIDIHDIDDLPDNEVLFAELRRIDPEAAQQTPPEPEVKPLPYGGIVMYCTQWCTDCVQARVWFKERNLDYTEVDVYSVPGALKQVREWTANRLVTPTFNIDGTIVVDFDPVRLEQVLGV